ncbi:MAG: aminodeoxychorismate synthase component I [Saprospiraceae bacterium]|nr:aminodeoxychorismate synthase component I [Saprospiraceae bacterium]
MNQYGAASHPFIFVIDFQKEHCLVCHHTQLDSRQVLFDINGFRNGHEPSLKRDSPVFESYPISFDDYLKAFENVKQQIQQGNSYLVNLTFETPIYSSQNLRSLFHSSPAKYKLMVDGQFLVFSPETFVRIESGKISSFPMKGTIDASIKQATEKILSDAKETAEHATIVDLIRNDLSMVAKNVVVERYRYIDTIFTHNKTLLQVSSEICGDLPIDYQSRVGDIIFSLLPAGSISGAPKNKTLKIIQQVESHRRGFYSGICGYFDGCNLDSGVMIRFIEQRDNQLFFKSGGGITNFSNPLLEYQEYMDKIYVPIA